MTGNGAMIQKMVLEQDNTGNKYYHCDKCTCTCTCIHVFHTALATSTREHGEIAFVMDMVRCTGRKRERGTLENGSMVYRWEAFINVLLLYLMIIIGW